MCKICEDGIGTCREDSEGLRRVLHRIIKKFHPEKIILHGSYARGDIHEGSDVDLIIVMNTKKRFVERPGEILNLNDTNFVIESLIYTPQEFERMKNRDFIRTALKEGLVLYQR